MDRGIWKMVGNFKDRLKQQINQIADDYMTFTKKDSGWKMRLSLQEYNELRKQAIYEISDMPFTYIEQENIQTEISVNEKEPEPRKNVIDYQNPLVRADTKQASSQEENTFPEELETSQEDDVNRELALFAALKD